MKADVHDESLPLPDQVLDDVLEAGRAALEPYRDHLVASRGEVWALTVSPPYRNREDARFVAFGTVDVGGRPRSSDDRHVEAVLTITENQDGPDFRVDATTDSWLDDDKMPLGGFIVGERLVPLAEAASAMLALVPPLMEHLDQILARLDAGERHDVE